MEKHTETDLSRSLRFHLVVLGLGLGVARLGIPGDSRGLGPTRISGMVLVESIYSTMCIKHLL